MNRLFTISGLEAILKASSELPSSPSPLLPADSAAFLNKPLTKADKIERRCEKKRQKLQPNLILAIFNRGRRGVVADRGAWG